MISTGSAMRVAMASARVMSGQVREHANAQSIHKERNATERNGLGLLENAGMRFSSAKV
jgi:hypothetical protein